MAIAILRPAVSLPPRLEVDQARRQLPDHFGGTQPQEAEWSRKADSDRPEKERPLRRLPIDAIANRE